MQMRRVASLTNAFSKKLDKHRVAFGPHVGWCNLCRMHEASRRTPTMALRVTEHVWTIGELAERALFALASTPAPRPRPSPSSRVPGHESNVEFFRVGR